jgi:hypothetical protein
MNTLFLGFPTDTGLFILGTIVISLIATITFYLGKWKL